MASNQDELAGILSKLQGFITSDGVALLEQGLSDTKELLLWIHYFRSHHGSKGATELLDGCQAAALEAVTYIGLGLSRAAISAIRLEIDLLLAFSFFCDHPKEWLRLQNTGDGFKLRSDIYNYHKEVDKEFGQRLTMIDHAQKKSLEQVYRHLSSYIHGQSPLTTPKSITVSDMVGTPAFAASVLVVQKETTVCLSNYLLAVHARDWSELPTEIVQRAATLLGSKKADFFS